jgi:hypothetical protein
MFCPSCGAPNNERDQRYCRECGATLPTTGADPRSIVQNSSSGNTPYAEGSGRRSSSLVSAGMKNKTLVGAAGLVVLVVALYLVVKVIIATITAVLLPLVVLLAVGFMGYLYLKNRMKQ